MTCATASLLVRKFWHARYANPVLTNKKRRISAFIGEGYIGVAMYIWRSGNFGFLLGGRVTR